MTPFIRKRDGHRYTCLLQPVTWPGNEKTGPCYFPRPAGTGGAHYKTIIAVEREYKKATD